MTTANAHFQVAADVLASWRDDVLTGVPPKLYPVGVGELARVEVGPGLVTLIGGAPGDGKTALSTQIAIDALRLTPTLRVLVCNVEMPPEILLDRQLARLSGVPLTTIRYRRLGAEHADRIDQAIRTLEPLAERLCFVRPPFSLENVAASADAFGANLILLDYIQRIAPPGEHDNKRGSVNATMDYLRQFADAGVAVIVVSAVGRTKDARGRSSYTGDQLNLASFRESSELEYGADDAFILHSVEDDTEDDVVRLRHLKSRHGEARDLWLRFERHIQRFTPIAPSREKPRRSQRANRARTGAAVAAVPLRKLWDRTAAAPDDDGRGDA